MATIHDLTDYIICRIIDGGGQLNQLKLQKLLYYVQAWHLVNFDKPLVDAKFQAWIHGPVNRETYDRFRGCKMLYSFMSREDVQRNVNSDKALTPKECACIEAVLEVYAPLSGDQLETLSHSEEPWIKARGDRPTDARCETEIDEETMKTYYKSLVAA